YIHDGRFVIVLDRGEEWQLGYVILKGGFQHLRAEGLEAVRASVGRLVAWLADRVGDLQGLEQLTVLAGGSRLLLQWYQPGLLLIGDAAHVMSPVGGVGINYAVQDAVEAANVLSRSLKAGKVTVADLAEVQRRREGPVRKIQKFQAFMQEHIAAPA